MKDLIDEIHEWRSDLMAQCDNDLEKLGEFFRRKESKHPRRVVNQITYSKSGTEKPPSGNNLLSDNMGKEALI
ncbi:MAG: hypothetical protein C4527_26910 [Candidatus Omnitrophota bacterium]|jgi:hypothetical protein|nr:MAG: hypothetical protein C4527_26910 [Candidatus Omnitrophota bacterium]